jgi:hypothetical protein
MSVIQEKIGTPALFEQLAEECAELAQAALKIARQIRGENPTRKTKKEAWADFLEEYADVELCLDLIPYGPDDYSEVVKIKKEKLQRWKRSLEKKPRN